MIHVETDIRRAAVKPHPLSIEDEIRAVRLINDLILLDDTWLDSDSKLLQRLLDEYRYFKLQSLKPAKRNKKGQFITQQKLF